jgi:hypothetical protein
VSFVLERLRRLRAKRRQPGLGAVSEPGRAEPLPASADAYVETKRGYLVPDDLPEPWQEWYEERAAIREYEGGQAREHAEAEALKETLDAMRRVSENLDGAL